MGKQTTIKDVAREAGVSVATVSRVLNNNYPVSVRKKKQVDAAIMKLGYVPNGTAQSLRKAACKDIGVIIPNVSNPFYLQTLVGINAVLDTHSYSLILCNTMGNKEYERRYLRQLFERQVKGVILSSVDSTANIIKGYDKKGMKFILLDQNIAGLEGSAISFDTCAGARIAMEYLIEQGHRRIAFATMPLTRWTRKEMHRGYSEALADAGILLDNALVYECSASGKIEGDNTELNAGRQIADDFLRDGCPATAVLCVNDMVAIGMMQRLIQEGVRIPDDLSVVGFDDISFASAFIPALTTVRYPTFETGRLAAMLLMDALNGVTEEPHVSLNLSPKLIIRDTVRALT